MIKFLFAAALSIVAAGSAHAANIPDTDPAYRNADSANLLAAALRAVRQQGCRRHGG